VHDEERDALAVRHDDVRELELLARARLRDDTRPPIAGALKREHVAAVARPLTRQVGGEGAERRQRSER
jgi:hypothetical protein